MLKDEQMILARSYLALSLRRISAVSQKAIADSLGVSEATISRFVTDDLDRACQVIAMAGLQICPKDVLTISQDDMRALERMAFKYLQTRIESGV